MVVVSSKRGSSLPHQLQLRQTFLQNNGGLARCVATFRNVNARSCLFFLAYASAILVLLSLISFCYNKGPFPALQKGFREIDSRVGEGTVAEGKSQSALLEHLPSYKCPIAYGTRGGGIETATYIQNAILEGFRCIVTSSHHQKHNETGVGEGWKAAIALDPSISRSDLFLQTMFVPADGDDFFGSPNDPDNMKNLPIAEQVDLTIKQSLLNLQTTYIDAVLFNNFRAKLHPFDEMFQAWQALEKYVDKGVIRYLGLTSVHDAGYLEKLHEQSRIKPVILQNRFHKNRNFDVALTSTIERLRLQVQRFWILTGNGGGHANNAMASEKGLTKQQLILAFVMSLGNTTALVGTHSRQHMLDDLSLIPRFHVDNDIFLDMYGKDQDRKTFAERLGMKGYTTSYPPETKLEGSSTTAKS